MKKLTAKTSPWVNVLIWGAVAVMVCANVFAGANIPWLVVFAPPLISLTIVPSVLAMLGLLMLFVHSLKAKADKK